MFNAGMDVLRHRSNPILNRRHSEDPNKLTMPALQEDDEGDLSTIAECWKRRNFGPRRSGSYEP